MKLFIVGRYINSEGGTVFENHPKCRIWQKTIFGIINELLYTTQNAVENETFS